MTGSSLRIAILLRCLDERGGISVYARNVTEELLRLATDDRFLLLYRSEAHRGSFGDRGGVRELVLPSRSKAVWDQWAVPLACRREGVDVVFHPKFTAPLLAPAPVVMTVHGADWLVPDQARYYPPLDVAYMRAMLPVYVRRCATVISVAELTTRDLNRALGLAPGKVRTVYFAPARHFRRVSDPDRLAEARSRYGLPDRFVLSLSKPDGGERKNAGGLFDAFRRIHARTGAELVVVGRDCERFRDTYGIPTDGWGAAVHFPGYVPQEDLPALYTLADLYLYPSNLEAFPIPLTEAMACGTPIVTSDVNGLREIAGEAALRVDPADPEAVAGAAIRLIRDPDLRKELSRRGLARSERFSWDRCGRRTLEILREAAGA